MNYNDKNYIKNINEQLEKYNQFIIKYSNNMGKKLKDLTKSFNTFDSNDKDPNNYTYNYTNKDINGNGQDYNESYSTTNTSDANSNTTTTHYSKNYSETFTFKTTTPITPNLNDLKTLNNKTKVMYGDKNSDQTLDEY